MRLRGVDSPEKGRRAKCQAEREVGQAATMFTRWALTKARIVLVRDPACGK